MITDFWNKVSDYVINPRAEPVDFDEQFRRAREKMPTPVFWLFGKTQSGKTSIIRALTGATDAEIGNVFRACTRTSRIYSFPSEEDCLIHFLDTRGLQEVHYTPADDIAYHEKEAHLLIVVVRAMDHSLDEVLHHLRAIRKRKPKWPVIVVQTSLHDEYAVGMGHPLPYPFDQQPLPDTVPTGLKRSLDAQRKQFGSLADRFVAVDLTLPGDGYDPEDYGLDALWQAIEEVLPIGLSAILKEQPEFQKATEAYSRAAHPHIVSYAIAAAGAGAVPVLNMPLVTGIQAQMFRAICSIFGQPFTKQLIAEFGAGIGVGFLAGLAGRSLMSFIPVYGTAVGSAYSGAVTYALGCTFCWYLTQMRDGVKPDSAKIHEHFAKEIQEARTRFKEYLKSRKSAAATTSAELAMPPSPT